MELSERTLRRSVAVFWALIALVWFYFGADFSAPLLEWDESIYYNAAQNVLDGRWLVPHISAGTNPLGSMDPFLEKPPLTYWIVALAMAIGGESPQIARLPSLLAMSCVIGLVVLLAVRLSRPATGVLAGFVALWMPAWTLTRGATQVATDPFLMLFGTAAIYSLVVFVGTGDSRWAWLSGIGYGGAILAKFVAAAPFGLFVLPYLYRHRDQIRWGGFGRVVVGGVAIALPWFIAVASITPDALVNQMLLDQVVQRAAGEGVVLPGDPMLSFMHFPYFQRLGVYFGWPVWALGLALAVSVGRKRLLDTVSDVDALMWPLAVGTIALYVVVGNHEWYIMPAAVPVAVLVADGITTCITPVLENLDLVEESPQS